MIQNKPEHNHEGNMVDDLIFFGNLKFKHQQNKAGGVGEGTVFSLRFSAADSLKDTPLRKWEPICRGMVGSSHWMGWEMVCILPACWASASLQQPCTHVHTHTHTSMQPYQLPKQYIYSLPLCIYDLINFLGFFTDFIMREPTCKAASTALGLRWKPAFSAYSLWPKLSSAAL